MPRRKREELVITNYLLLDEITISDDKKVTRRNYKIPHTMEAVRVTAPKHRTVSFEKRSSTGGLSKKRFLASLFLHNEIKSCVQEVIDREGMLRSMRREFKNWPARQSRNFFNHWSTHRRMYNEGRLHHEQPLPLLYAWVWNVDGYIRHSKVITQYYSFEYCRRHLLAAKFLDPRFFTLKEIKERRDMEAKEDEHLWNIPSLSEIKQVEEIIKRPLYNSILFPPGYEKGCAV